MKSSYCIVAIVGLYLLGISVGPASPRQATGKSHYCVVAAKKHLVPKKPSIAIPAYDGVCYLVRDQALVAVDVQSGSSIILAHLPTDEPVMLVSPQGKGQVIVTTRGDEFFNLWRFTPFRGFAKVGISSVPASLPQ